jgi:hypothetical protein
LGFPKVPSKLLKMTRVALTALLNSGFPSKIRDFLILFDCFSRHSWTLEKAHVPDHSHQPNTNQWDCGLFVLFYSDFILQKKKIGFNEAWVSASRNYVASCILKNLILA